MSEACARNLAYPGESPLDEHCARSSRVIHAYIARNSDLYARKTVDRPDVVLKADR